MARVGGQGNGAGFSPGSRSSRPASGRGLTVSLECPASLRASSWARKSISSSSLGCGRLSPGEREGSSGRENPAPQSTLAKGDHSRPDVGAWASLRGPFSSGYHGDNRGSFLRAAGFPGKVCVLGGEVLGECAETRQEEKVLGSITLAVVCSPTYKHLLWSQGRQSLPKSEEKPK
jgi:hypothetical protein